MLPYLILGYVLSRKALDRFINLALKGKGQNKSCRIEDDTGAEDAEMGLCLEGVNVKAGDSRDDEGKERFFPFNPTSQITPSRLPPWFWKHMYYNSENVGNILIKHY